MALKSSVLKAVVLTGLVLGVLVFLGFWYRVELVEKISRLYRLFSDRDQIRNFIASFGMGAPLVFMGIQVLQVLFAPVPGEATGFIGGYLFGTAKGFMYSSIALTAGSWINFMVGRFLGERFVRKMIPAVRFEKLDRMVKRQGIIVLFILFVFPGFPKDYLCFFLGLSTLPARVFILLVGIGRMPGTLILSLQGASLFERSYLLLGLLAAGCAALSFLAYRYREQLYQWVEKRGQQRAK